MSWVFLTSLLLQLAAILGGNGVTAINVYNSSSNWKCNTVNAVGPCNGVGTSGGVGTNDASAATMTFGSTGEITLSTTQSTGETQGLYINTQRACDNCTAISEDKWIQPIGDATINANIEVDMFQTDSTHTIGGDTVFHMFGLQCNQQPGNPADGYWQIDNEQGSWTTTTITAGCPLSTTNWTRIIYSGHWIIGDTGCGGYGCSYFDTLSIEVCTSPNQVSCSVPLTTYFLATSLESYVESGWASACGIQDQIDLTNTVQSGLNPTTGGRYVQLENIRCSIE